VFFWAGRVEGRGVLYDLSIGGARIDEAAPQMPAGTEIGLTFALREDDSPIQIRGEVVRETPDGFGVKFTEVNEQLREWIELIISESKEQQRQAGL
jgi:c-di-GMP-binding flagellar brake protein YcgR